MVMVVAVVVMVVTVAIVVGLFVVRVTVVMMEVVMWRSKVAVEHQGGHLITRQPVVAAAVMSTHESIVLVLYQEGNLVSGHWIQQSIINKGHSPQLKSQIQRQNWAGSFRCHGRNDFVFEFHQKSGLQVMSVTIHDIKLETVDFDWIRDTTKISHLKRAIALIQQDGNYYTELKDACYARMTEIDPTCKKLEPNRPVSNQLQAEINSQLTQWETSLTHNQTSNMETNLEDYEKYFDNEANSLSEKKRKERAENERMKGNEAIKSKDFDEAITYYSRSLELDPNMYQAFGNRALAYFKKKQFQKCLEDCERAIVINPAYIKAHHRKAKAHIELKNKVRAYRSYKEILRLQPQNSEVNQQMMELRAQMSEQEIRELQSQLIPRSEFKKITIEEDSDEEIQEK